MDYFNRIQELSSLVSPSLVNFDESRVPAHTPTQASSNFITNKQQGDWAEEIIIRVINETSNNYIAVKYGKSDDLIAGDESFDLFFQEFQEELDTIGKRPDLLIFNKSDFDTNKGYDISHIPHPEIADYVKKAIAGIEVRSSAFLIEEYEKAMQERTEYYTQIALETKSKILNEYSNELNTTNRKIYLEILNSITPETISIIDFKVPGWRASERLSTLNDLLKQLKAAIKEVKKRDSLSITPKVEDIKVGYKWIETFNVPHFYFQVFFDKVYGISFEQILNIISNPENEDDLFSVGGDNKNQNKVTIKINSRCGTEIANKVDEPEHKSVRKLMNKGRLLYYVTFSKGCAYLDIENLSSVLNINSSDF
ncbi:MAG: AccI family restriction endonuclease [Bacteroidales bacterium]